MNSIRKYHQGILDPCRNGYGLKVFFTALLLLTVFISKAQYNFFNRVMAPPGKPFLHVTGIVQDLRGYMWFASKNGLFRYDGYGIKQYRNDPLNPNSLITDGLESICIDKKGILWIGTINSGLERFDPVTEVFTHYRHDPGNPASLVNDTISVVYADRNGMIWIGANGLDQLDPETGRFRHYKHKASDRSSLSTNNVRAIYEDKKGDLWIGTGSVYGPPGNDPDDGGLHRMNRRTGTFTRYKHDPNDSQSLVNNKVRAIFEDSKGNFWIGTAGDGLHTMNRASGKFERHSYDAQRPEKLSRPPLKKAPYFDHITFITEDQAGGIWIGTAESGLNYYDPVRKRIEHFENQKDSAGRFIDYTAWTAYTSREGVLWISTLHETVYRINPEQVSIPFYKVPSRGATTFYTDANHHLWIGTDGNGIRCIDTQGKVVNTYNLNPTNDPGKNSNHISVITPDREGNLWIGMYGHGLNRYDKKTGNIIRFRYDSSREQSTRDFVISIYPDPDLPDILWIGSFKGLDRVDKKTGKFRNYKFHPNDNLDFGPNAITCVLKDRRSTWWAASWERGGLHRFDPGSGKIKTYLQGASIVRVHEDHQEPSGQQDVKDCSAWTGRRMYSYGLMTWAFFPRQAILPIFWKMIREASG